MMWLIYLFFKVEPKAAAPVNLSAISAAFCHLLKAPGKNGLPLK